MEDWEKTFNVIRYNPITFLEHYYNIVEPENKVELTREQKQHFFNKYKDTRIPLFDDFKAGVNYSNKIDELKTKQKAEGKEDWENYAKL